MRAIATLVLLVLCLQGALTDQLQEIVVADLEPPSDPLFWPLDQWGDWFRGAKTWDAERELSPDAAVGQQSVKARFMPRDPENPAGWWVQGLRVWGEQWQGASELRFWIKTERPQTIKVVLYSDQSVWNMQPIGEELIDAKGAWTEFRVPFADMAIPGKQAPDPAQARALAWVIEGDANTIWLDHVRVAYPPDAYLSATLQQLRQAEADFQRDLRIYEARGYHCGGLWVHPEELSRSLSECEGAFAESSQALSGARRTIAEAEHFCFHVNDLIATQQRLKHYQDKLEALRDKATEGHVQDRLPSLWREFEQAAELAAQAKLSLADGDLEKFRLGEMRAAELTDELWLAMKPVWDATSGMYVRAEGPRWVKPNGEVFTPLAPFLFSNLYQSWSGWRPPVEREFHALAEIGFNAIRLPVYYHRLEPEQGSFSESYLAQCKQCIEWADKYGMHVIIDIHWPYPDWFYKGPADCPTVNKEEQNPYVNPDALVDTFRRLGREFAGYRNVVAYEIPTNEPAISSIEVWDIEGNDPTIADIRLLMKSWSAWLLARYGTREALDKAWRTGAEAGANGLGKDETWDAASILPPGKRGETARHSTRLPDYIAWALDYHADLCKRCADAIHETAPWHFTQQQHMAGGAQWEKDPIPVHFYPLHQTHRDGVQVGTHYGLGSWPAAMVSAAGCPSYNSEERAEGRAGIYARQHARGQGASPFPFFRYDGLVSWDYRIKDSTAFLPCISEFWDAAVRTRRSEVLVVVDTLKAALAGGLASPIPDLLEAMDVEYDVAASQYLNERPETADEYRVVLRADSIVEPDAASIAKLLADAGVSCVFPTTWASENLETYDYEDYIVVYSKLRDKSVRATLKTNVGLVSLTGDEVSQQIGRDGRSRVEIPAPWASNASFFRKTDLIVEPTRGRSTIQGLSVVERTAGTRISFEIDGKGSRISLSDGRLAEAGVEIDGASAQPGPSVLIPGGCHRVCIQTK